MRHQLLFALGIALLAGLMMGAHFVLPNVHAEVRLPGTLLFFAGMYGVFKGNIVEGKAWRSCGLKDESIGRILFRSLLPYLTIALVPTILVLIVCSARFPEGLEWPLNMRLWVAVPMALAPIVAFAIRTRWASQMLADQSKEAVLANGVGA